MANRNSPPLEATLLPDSKPRKSWVPLIMGSILVGSCVLALVFGVCGLIWLINSMDRPGTFVGGNGNGKWPSVEEKQAEYRSVFKLPVAPLPDIDVPQIEKFLTRYVVAAKASDHGGLARLVDVPAFLQRMQEHPDMPRLDMNSRKALVAELNKSLELPNDVTDYHLLGIKRLAKEGFAVADVILQHATGASEPCRFWLQQKERAWSVVDWEMIPQGKSQAGQWAGAQRTAQDYMYGTMYDGFVNDLEKADDRYYQGDLQGAIRFVQAADQRNLPPYVHKEMQLAVATRYYQYRQYGSAIDCLNTIDAPNEVPGYYVIRTQCYQVLGRSAEAIAAAADYERLCGFSPDVVRAKAQALIQLGKNSEAMAEFKRLLEFNPSDQIALQQWVGMLPLGQKGQIAELISRTKDPPATALAVAGNFRMLEDAEATQAIRVFLEKKFANVPATHAFVAHVHQHEEEHDLAAAAFRRAHAAAVDAEEKKQQWNNYVVAMHSAGKLIQAYEESPSSVEVFDYLTEGIDIEESVIGMKELPPLLEAHRRRAPNDPRLFYCTGLWAQQQGNLAGAEEAFAAGEAKASDESLKEELQYARLGILGRQGRILDAYREYEKLDGAFRILAEQCREQHKPDVLEELLRARRKSEPKDPDIALYAISLDIERGNYLPALKALQQQSDDEEQGEMINHRLIRLYVDAYEKYVLWEESLLHNPPPTEVLHSLAARFVEQESWDKLRKLLALGNLRSSNQGQWLLYELKMAWHFHQYSRIQELVPRWNPTIWASVAKHEQKWARETVVRSLLRLGNTSGAYDFAERFQREFAEEFPLLLVRLAQGDTKELPELIQNERYRFQSIAQDAELLPLLTDKRFAAMRREISLELPGGNPRTSLVLFLRKATQLDEERLRKLLPQEGEFQVKLLPATSHSGRTLAVTHAEGIIFLTSGDTPLHLLPEDLELIRSRGNRTKDSGDTLMSDLKKHQGWLTIELLDSPAVLTGPREDRLAKRLVQALCDENLVAIALDELMTPSTLVPGNLLPRESLTPDRSWTQWLAGGSQLWLSLEANPQAEEKPPLGRKAQREFVAQVAKLPSGQMAQVRVELRLGRAIEEVWLNVARLERLEYGGYQLTCELLADSQLYPHWKAGERCNVSFWQVKETRLP